MNTDDNSKDNDEITTPKPGMVFNVTGPPSGEYSDKEDKEKPHESEPTSSTESSGSFEKKRISVLDDDSSDKTEPEETELPQKFKLEDIDEDEKPQTVNDDEPVETDNEQVKHEETGNVTEDSAGEDESASLENDTEETEDADQKEDQTESETKEQDEPEKAEESTTEKPHTIEQPEQEVDPKNWPEEDELETQPVATAETKSLVDDAPVVTSPQKTDKPHAKMKQKNPKRVIAVVLVILLIIGLVGFGYYYFFLQPKVALASYFNKFTNEESMPKSMDYTFSTNVKDSSNQVYKLAATGKIDNTNEDQFLASVNLNGNFGESTDSKKQMKIDTELIVKNTKKEGSGYINIHEPKFIEQIIPGVLNKWIELPSDTAAPFVGFSCDEPKASQLSSYVNSRLSEIKLEEARRVSIFPQQIEGKLASHYQGKLSGAELSRFVEDVDKKSKSICGNGGYGEDFYNELKNISISYDLWTGKDIDRIALVVTSNGKFDVAINFNTSAYGTSKNISIPQKSTPLEEITSDLQQSISEYTNSEIDTTQPQAIDIPPELVN